MLKIYCRPLQLLLLTLTLSLLANTVIARDISGEQRSAYKARQAYNKAKANHADLTQQIEQQKKRVADAQARLHQLQTDQANAQAAVDFRKNDLDEKVRQLNAAWDERDKR